LIVLPKISCEVWSYNSLVRSGINKTKFLQKRHA